MPPGQLAGIARTRLNNRMRALAWKRLGWTPARGGSVSPALAGQAADSAARLLLGDRASELRAWFLARPESAGRVLARAEDVMAHRTSLLGSDRAPLGDRIDWHRDWVTGTAWPREHFSELDLLKLDERCDVKRCWDLSRAYHWVWLAQAFWLTDDRRFLEEIERQWTDWLDQNPPEIGVNWANAMEAAIRTVSWWWVLALTAGRLDARLLTRACGSLQTHLDYILAHLEFAGDNRNSNHLLADYAGLSFGGLLFADHPSSAAWRETGLRGLWRELPLQVYPDGVNYEQSSEYHRFIAEFFLYTALVARRAGHEPGREAWDRIERMLDVCMHLTRPDGLANAIGDGDDGRLFWLTERAPLDFRGLLGVGAVVFGRGDFRFVAGASAGAGAEQRADPLDDVAWTLGLPGVEAFERLPAQVPASTTAAFTDGGVYVARTGWSASRDTRGHRRGLPGNGPRRQGFARTRRHVVALRLVARPTRADRPGHRHLYGRRRVARRIPRRPDAQRRDRRRARRLRVRRWAVPVVDALHAAGRAMGRVRGLGALQRIARRVRADRARPSPSPFHLDVQDARRGRRS